MEIFIPRHGARLFGEFAHIVHSSSPSVAGRQSRLVVRSCRDRFQVSADRWLVNAGEDVEETGFAAGIVP
jgi:hypothetical protein